MSATNAGSHVQRMLVFCGTLTLLLVQQSASGQIVSRPSGTESIKSLPFEVQANPLTRNPSPESLSLNLADAPIIGKVWIKWRSQTPEQWSGSIEIKNGELIACQRLGQHADAAACIRQQGNRIRVLPGVPRAFDGVCIDVLCTSQSTAVIDLDTVAISCKQPSIVLVQSDQATDATIDVNDNAHISVQRQMPHMRIAHQHPSLIFSPGEHFKFEVTPINAPKQANRIFHCDCYVAQDGQEINLSRVTRIGMTDRFGVFKAPRPFDVELPKSEGAYEIVVETKTNSGVGSGAATTLLETRLLEVVVLSEEQTAFGEPRPVDAQTLQWNEKDDWSFLKDIKISDVAIENNRQSDEHAASFWNGGVSNEHPTTDADPLSHTVRRVDLVNLPVNHPLLLEALLPAEIAMRYRFTLRCVDTDTIVFDSFVDVPGLAAIDSPNRIPHRLPFWTDAGNLQLQIEQIGSQIANSRSATIRIHQGRDHLPSFATPRRNNMRRIAPLVRLDSLIRRVAPETPRTEGRQFARSWTELYRIGSRFIELLQYNAFDTAILQVLDSGATIYPSDVVSVVPGIDGANDSPDSLAATSKDALEFWFRLFDREGLSLIPSLHFDAALLQVEAERIELDPVANSLADDDRFANLKCKISDQKVQEVIVNAINEIHQRYNHHPSFAGVAVVIDDQSFFIDPKQRELQSATRKAIEELLQVPANRLVSGSDSRRLYALEFISGAKIDSLLGDSSPDRDRTLAWLSGSQFRHVTLPYELLTDEANARKVEWINSPTGKPGTPLAGDFSQLASCRLLARKDVQMMVLIDDPFSDGQIDHARRFRRNFQRISQDEHAEFSGLQASSDPAVRVRFSSDAKSGYAMNASPWRTIIQLRFENADPMPIALRPFELQQFSPPNAATKLDGWDCIRHENDHSLALAWCQKMEGRLSLAESLTFPPCQAIRNPGFNHVDENGLPTSWRLFRGHGIEMELSSRVAGTHDVALKIATYRSRFWTTPPAGCVQSAPFNFPSSGRMALKARIALAPGTKPQQVQFAVIEHPNSQRIPITTHFTATGVADPENPIWYDFTMEPEVASGDAKETVSLRIELHDGGCIYLDHLEAYDTFLKKQERTMLNQLLVSARQSIDQQNFSGVEAVRRHPLTQVLMSQIALVPDSAIPADDPMIVYNSLPVDEELDTLGPAQRIAVAVAPPTSSHFASSQPWPSGDNGKPSVQTGTPNVSSLESERLVPKPSDFPNLPITNDVMIGGVGQTVQLPTNQDFRMLADDEPAPSSPQIAKLDIQAKSSQTDNVASDRTQLQTDPPARQPMPQHQQTGLFDMFRKDSPQANIADAVRQPPTAESIKNEQRTTARSPNTITSDRSASENRKSRQPTDPKRNRNKPPRQVGLFEMLRGGQAK